MRYIILFLFVVNILFGFDKVYILPDDSKIAQKEIIRLLNKADKSIKIAMYNFSYKKFAKVLNKKAKNIKVELFYTKSKLDFKNFKAIKTKRKLHTKIALIDDKIAIFGSANWTKKSFKQNYEIIQITNNKRLVKQINKFFKILGEQN